MKSARRGLEHDAERFDLESAAREVLGVRSVFQKSHQWERIEKARGQEMS